MVNIKFDDNNAYVNCANFEMVCRLIEGRYPNYNSVIPAVAKSERLMPFSNICESTMIAIALSFNGFWSG